ALQSLPEIALLPRNFTSRHGMNVHRLPLLLPSSNRVRSARRFERGYSGTMGMGEYRFRVRLPAWRCNGIAVQVSLQSGYTPLPWHGTWAFSRWLVSGVDSFGLRPRSWRTECFP